MATRTFRLQDGKSDKFWSISLDGDTHTVHFGRSGTAGQTRSKSFATAEEAERSCERLIAQKTKKGYVEESEATQEASTKTKPKARPRSTKAKAKPAKAKPTKPKAKPKPTKPKTTRPKTTKGVEFEPRLDLTPAAALYRQREPLDRGLPRPFEPSRSLDELRGLETRYSRSFHSPKLWSGLGRPLSSEEAGFWYRVLERLDYRTTPTAVADELAQLTSFEVDPQEAAEALRADPTTQELSWVGTWGAGACVPVLVDLFGERELNDLIHARLREANRWSAPCRDHGLQLIDAYRRHVVPYLSHEERARFAKVVAEGFDPAAFQAPTYSAAPMQFYFAALLGCRDEISALFASFPDDRFEGDYQHYYLAPNLLVFGLDDPARMTREARRLKIRFRDPEEIEGWLACTGCAALDVVADSVLEQGSDEVGPYARALLRALDPDALPAVLALRVKRKTAKLVGRWLQDHPGIAARGLIRMLAAGDEGAGEALADLAEDAPKIVARALELEDPGEEVAARVSDLLDDGEPRPGAALPPALAAAEAAVARLPPLKRKQVAEWLRPARLKPPKIGDQALNPEQVSHALRALLEVPLTDAAPGPGVTYLAELRRAADRASLEAFGWSAYAAWERNGFPPEQKWILAALGHLGGDATVARLTPRVRAWPGESQHARAVLGLECLRAIGSDVALGALAGIAQKLKFRALKQRAGEYMEQIATQRGLSREALADRLVPDCGLGPDGGRVFDYGSRSFSFCLGPELKPMVRDGKGKLLKSPPKPGKRDDAELAPAAHKAWRSFRKQVLDVLKIQRGRLEQAMVAGRRWSPADFRAYVAEHPLLRTVAQGILWGVYTGDALVALRLDEGGQLRDLEDQPQPLPPLAQVGPVHPLQLDPAQRQRWLELWDRKGLLAPFPQLDREVLRFPAKALVGTRFTHACGALIPPRTLRRVLLGQGWTRGEPQDAGIVGEHVKHFPAAGLTAVLQHGGLCVVPYEFEEAQPVEGVLFLEGTRAPGDCVWLPEGAGLPLEQIDATVLSEVARDLTRIEQSCDG